MELFHVPLALISFTRQQSVLELSRLHDSRKSLVSAPPQWAGTTRMELFRTPAVRADRARIWGVGVLSAGSLSLLRLTVIGDHAARTCLGAKANAVGANEPCENCTHWLGMTLYFLLWPKLKVCVFSFIILMKPAFFFKGCSCRLFHFAAWPAKNNKAA